jgi:beta propeller repeat protein
MNGRVKMNTNKKIVILISVGILYLIVTSMVDIPSIFESKENLTGPTILGVSSDQISSYHIYLYDISAGRMTTIASNSAILLNPSIYEDRVVYTSYENGNGDIYMYDISTGETKQITSDPYDQDSARIYEDVIVWDDSRSEHEKGSRVTDKRDIYMYDLGTGVESLLIKTNLPDRLPDIYGDVVVYEVYLKGIYGNVNLYRLSTGRSEEITSKLSGHEYIRIHKDKIVWYSTDTQDIFLHDLSTGETTRLTDTLESETYPTIYENTVVYPRSLSEKNSDVYAYDLNTGEEIRITDTPDFVEKLPDVYGNRIAFVRMYSLDKMDVIIYSMDTGKEVRVGSLSDFNYGPEIYGDKVVWSAFDIYTPQTSE